MTSQLYWFRNREYPEEEEVSLELDDEFLKSCTIEGLKEKLIFTKGLHLPSGIIPSKVEIIRGKQFLQSEWKLYDLHVSDEETLIVQLKENNAAPFSRYPANDEPSSDDNDDMADVEDLLNLLKGKKERSFKREKKPTIDPVYKPRLKKKADLQDEPRKSERPRKRKVAGEEMIELASDDDFIGQESKMDRRKTRCKVCGVVSSMKFLKSEAHLANQIHMAATSEETPVKPRATRAPRRTDFNFVVPTTDSVDNFLFKHGNKDGITYWEKLKPQMIDDFPGVDYNYLMPRMRGRWSDLCKRRRK